MYESLYRKYRPKNLDEIVGQEKVVEILKNQVINQKVGHAYLFTGVRGTGKTSIAKIMARAFNCKNTIDGNPCNSCASCLSILSGNNTDIIEMDAASNNGVDDIREIIDESAFLPTSSEYRVYIIDEVHMLSMGAFNALLKTLEEPPAHVKFILATTDPQKLPATILSRCQRFEFTKISEEKIYKLLKKISDDIGLDAEDEALKVLATLAKGSARDGISLLESVKNLKGNITTKKVKNVLAIPESKKTLSVFTSIILGEKRKLDDLITEFLEEGKEPITIITEFLDLVYTIYLSKEAELFKFDEDVRLDVKMYFELDKLEIYKIIKKVLKILSEMRYIENKNIMLKAGFLNILEENINNKYLEESYISAKAKVKKFKEAKSEVSLKKQIKDKIEIKNDKNEKEDEKEDDNFSKNVLSKTSDNISVEAKIIISNENENKDNIQESENIETNILEKENKNEIHEESFDSFDNPMISLENKEDKVEENDLNVGLNLKNEKEDEKEEKNEEKKENINKKIVEPENLHKEKNKNISENQHTHSLITIDTLEIRKKMLELKNTPLFVALSNVKMFLDGDTLKINVKPEINEKSLEILNTNKALETIEKVVSAKFNKKIKAEYIYK